MKKFQELVIFYNVNAQQWMILTQILAYRTKDIM